MKITIKELTFKNIFYYIQGNIRYKLYYSDLFKWLIRKHIKEQIEYRIKVMNRECYYNGSCIKCGCQTTHLQMCNKACEGSCYPEMFDKVEWMIVKNYYI